MNECTSVAGHFYSHGSAPVKYRAHRPMKEVQGFHKTLNSAIGRLLSPYCPGSRQEHNQHNDEQHAPPFASHFDGRGDAAVLYPAHRPME